MLACVVQASWEVRRAPSLWLRQAPPDSLLRVQALGLVQLWAGFHTSDVGLRFLRANVNGLKPSLWVASLSGIAQPVGSFETSMRQDAHVLGQHQSGYHAICVFEAGAATTSSNPEGGKIASSDSLSTITSTSRTSSTRAPAPRTPTPSTTFSVSTFRRRAPSTSSAASPEWRLNARMRRAGQVGSMVSALLWVWAVPQVDQMC